ncbi:hypothetical protein scyTo_0007648 [Scyliorhinus torazame]|uniref:Beta/gamma crystallin 'Greek key' domain-containing protein n=1 Tax=Scyliorhinus torazame TaxID=75743 RepID=A0A401NW57_SCYTO|nr:hypothetical protein [Scyliorhinus torazame]
MTRLSGGSIIAFINVEHEVPEQLLHSPIIIFYEDRNFQGRHYECSNDCADLSSYFSRCNSMRVMSDWWVMYERPNYMGYQYVLSRGEYPDYQRWMGFNDSIGSCRTYPYIIFYEDRNFQGRHYECSNDCADLSPYFSRCNSMRVMSDWWVMYERPNYMGYQYVLSRGEYPDYQRWMGFNDNIGSCRTYPYIIFYEDRNFQGRHYECSNDCADLSPYFSRCNSMRVMSDWWVMYERPNYMGYQYVLSRGEYPDYQRWMGFNDNIGSCRTYPHIIFYEDRNFQGRHYECSNDCADLSPYFSRCNSMRVMSDWWVMYERPNYMGYQYVLSKGEYPDYQRWMGFNDSIRSCRTYPYIIFYEDRNFQGRHYECSNDCADLSTYFSRCNSMRVMSDWWVMYERPNYMGYQYVLSRGEYPDYQRWMGFNDSIGSCRTYPYYQGGNYRMRIYERPDFGGQMMEFMDDCPSVYPTTEADSTS